jgi:acyl carrier protein
MSDREAGAAAADARGRILAFVQARFPAAANMRLDDETSLLDSGVIDSLGVLDIVSFLEESFGVKVGDEELTPQNFESVGALARFVARKKS